MALRLAGSLVIGDVMTPAPAVLHVTHSIRAAQRMLAEKPFQHFPVIGDKRLVGIVSDHDVATYLAKHPNTLDLEIGQVMTPDPITVSPETSLAEAARLLVDHGIHCLPVVGYNGILLGIVTDTDLLRVLISFLKGVEPDLAALQGKSGSGQ
jgi:CBS domain-containing protein